MKNARIREVKEIAKAFATDIVTLPYRAAIRSVHEYKRGLHTHNRFDSFVSTVLIGHALPAAIGALVGAEVGASLSKSSVLMYAFAAAGAITFGCVIAKEDGRVLLPSLNARKSISRNRVNARTSGSSLG